MGILGKKFTEKEATETAIKHIRENKGKNNIEVVEVEENSGNWTVKGICSSDREASTWAEKFEIVVNKKGKIKSKDYSLRWQKNEADKSWTIHTDPITKTIKPEDELCNLESRPDIANPNTDSENVISKQEYPKSEEMKRIEQTATKIESLKTQKNQLDIEHQKMMKKIGVKTTSLELEIKGIQYEISKMREILSDEEDKTLDHVIELTV